MARDAFFYAIEDGMPIKVLPVLLEKSLKSGWFINVVVSGSEAAQTVDTYLWTYKDISFLPHKLVSTGETDMDAQTPILLHTDMETVRSRDVLLFFDCYPPSQLNEAWARERFIFLFSRWDERWSLILEAVQAASIATACWLLDIQGKWHQETRVAYKVEE